MEAGFHLNIIRNILIGGPNNAQGQLHCPSHDVDVLRKRQIEELLLTLVEGSWNILIPMDSCSYRHMTLPTSKWLASLKPLKFIDVKRDNSSSVM